MNKPSESKRGGQFKDITTTEIMQIMVDARTSKQYLDETKDITSSQSRRCVNVLANVKFLLENDRDFLAAFNKADTKNMIGLFGTQLYDLGGWL